jgi:hypothetical protein
MPTTPNGIEYPDGSSAITPLESHFENLADTADTAITALKANIRGANSDDTIYTLKQAIVATDTRLALNLQDGAGAPSGAPSNSGTEGSMYYDTTNDALYIWDNSDWRLMWNKTPIVRTNLTSPVIITAVNTSEWTINDYTYTEKNGMVNLSINVKRKGGDLSAGNITNENVFTISSGYRPIGVQAPGLGGSAGPVTASYISGSTGTGVITAIGSAIADELDINMNYVFIKE